MAVGWIGIYPYCGFKITSQQPTAHGAKAPKVKYVEFLIKNDSAFSKVNLNASIRI